MFFFFFFFTPPMPENKVQGEMHPSLKAFFIGMSPVIRITLRVIGSARWPAGVRRREEVHRGAQLNIY